MGYLRQARRFLLIGLFAALAFGSEAERLYEEGRKAEKKGDDVQAYLLYSRARAEDPSDPKYIFAAESVRMRAAGHLAALGRQKDANALQPGLLPELDGGVTLQKKPAPPRAPELRPPVELDPDRVLTGFKIDDTVQAAYEQIAKAYGLKVIFDGEFDGKQKVRFHLDDVYFDQAVIALGGMAQAFVIPVAPKLFMVAEDSQQKRTELEPHVTATIPVPEAVSAEDLTQIGQAVQQALDIKRFQANPTTGALTMRGTAAQIKLARELVDHLAKPKAEVLVEVDAVSVNNDRQVDIGVKLPNMFSITNFSTIWNAVVPPIPMTPLFGFGGGQTIFGMTIGTAVVTARLMSSNARTLQSFRLRATSGMPAELLVGERYPIINASFAPIVFNDEINDAIDDGTLRTPFPSFTFEDLGLIFKFTPQVHSAREVTMEVDAEVKLLAGGAVNGVPILANRKFNAVARMKEGETAILFGISILERRNTGSGVAGLSEIPLLGWLFKDQTRRYNQSDLLFLVRPRVVRLPAAEIDPSITLRVGPESRPIPAL